MSFSSSKQSCRMLSAGSLLTHNRSFREGLSSKEQTSVSGGGGGGAGGGGVAGASFLPVVV